MGRDRALDRGHPSGETAADGQDVALPSRESEGTSDGVPDVLKGVEGGMAKEGRAGAAASADEGGSS
eukprot:3304827-Pyramimonas_sp.AAC.1